MLANSIAAMAALACALAFLEAGGIEAFLVGLEPAEFAAVIAAERKTWGATIAKFNINLP